MDRPKVVSVRMEVNVHPRPRSGAPKETHSRRLLRRFEDFLKMGLTPDSIALCVAVGIVVGTFPLFGITTLLAAAIALTLRLNLPLIEAVNYLMTPIHLLAILPWVRAGEKLFGRPHVHMKAKEVLFLVQNHPWEAVNLIGWDILRAVVAWSLAAPFLILLLFWILKPLSHRVAARLKLRTHP
jgi:uncharacterized protein (DUF2062 family)